jgi:acyl carrier protein
MNPSGNPGSHPVHDFIVQLLEEKGAVPDPAALPAYRYLDVGHIDSLAFIKFIFRIEERFGIRFSEADMLGDRIKTVGGLVALIEEKLRQAPTP